MHGGPCGRRRSGLEGRGAAERLTGVRAMTAPQRLRWRCLEVAGGQGSGMTIDPRSLRPSASFPASVIAEIQRAAREGLYEIRGFGAKRQLPTFDDLVFLGASVSRYPLEGYRERCATNVTIGTRFAEKPIELAIPITIAGMSFGALGAHAKEALGRAATAMGTSTTTGDGGMTDEERAASKTLVYQVLPSRYGLNPDDLRRADAIEIVVGQGAKPGGGGMLLGLKITERVAAMRTLPAGHRPAQRLPPPRLDRPRRPHDQDRRAARDHRLAKADLRQDRRDPDQLRHRARGQGRGRRDRARRHAGRHRRDPGRVHRARRHPDPARGPPGGRGAAGAGHAPQGAADRLRRHPQRRRRRQGAGHGRGRGLDRHRGADRAQLQRAALRGRLRRARHRARLLPPLPHRPLPGRHHDPGPGARAAPRRRAGGAPGAQLPQHAWCSRRRRWRAPAASRTS